MCIRDSDNTYAMTLKEITTESTESKEWITDGVRYIASEPYGLESGKEFLFYTPQTSVKNLTEEFIGWGYGSVCLLYTSTPNVIIYNRMVFVLL